ncbi:MAG: hypothetical protein V2I38_02125 [Alcanivoracaceae bacterium]|nr:hypothetical protein [Alcanivoracaceae bacterium]
MIVAQQEIIDADGRQATLLHFHRGQVLRILADSVALYRDRASVDDPLGNGVVGHELIPSSICLQFDSETGFVGEQRAGFVGLHGGAVLFIRPDGIALYDDAGNALRNRDAHWLIPFVKAN